MEVLKSDDINKIDPVPLTVSKDDLFEDTGLDNTFTDNPLSDDSTTKRILETGENSILFTSDEKAY